MSGRDWQNGLLSEATERESKMTATFDAMLATKYQNHYRCSGCWGRVVAIYTGKGQSKMLCSNCGEVETFVTEHYVEQRKQEDAIDTADAKRNLASVLGLKKDARTTEELIHELGF